MYDVDISYNFFEDYLDDPNFNNIFNKRISKIKNQYKKMLNMDNIIEDFFVEIFCWTVLPKDTLFEINGIFMIMMNDFVPRSCYWLLRHRRRLRRWRHRRRLPEPGRVRRSGSGQRG